MAAITLRGIAKTYDNGFQAVRSIDLDIADKEFMVLVGPSGCGKTTTLRMIAGLEDCTAGELSIGGRVVNAVAPKDRDIAMVFQSYALYPHMNVRDNMAFGLTLRKVAKDIIDTRVAEAARLLSLDSQLKKLPKQLSGGQRQRVALGRAIVRQPQAFLFDEPLSNLDAKLRGEMRYELKTLQQRLQATMVYVTHDQVEAMTLGDRITVMDKGDIQQVAAPMELYDNPANRFVAGFIGSPGMNFLDGEVVADGASRRFRLAGGQEIVLAMPAAPRLQAGRAVLGLRPDHLEPGDDGLEARIRVVELMGDHQVVYAELPGLAQPLVLTCDGHLRLRAGEPCRLRADTSRAHVFASTGDHAVNLTLP